MDELVSGQTSQSRFTMWLMGIFAASALMLAVVGIYGVMSYLVTQRTREIGIRLALGADGRDILRLVVGNGARMIGAGIAIGVVAAFALQRLVSIAALRRDRRRRRLGPRRRGAGGCRAGRLLPAGAARDAGRSLERAQVRITGCRFPVHSGLSSGSYQSSCNDH